MYVKDVVVQNQVGLHARPATFFIQKANEFKSSIWVEKDDRKVNAKSLLGVLSLGITKGTTINIVADGVDEVDMVINICDVKNGDYDSVRDEIASIKSICGTHILKVIIETCYLTMEEKIKLCEIVTEAGADYIKTSTGFGTAGATLEDIRLFKEHIGENVKIKAAGGIRTVEDMSKYIELGCDRLGCSSTSVLFE